MERIFTMTNKDNGNVELINEDECRARICGHVKNTTIAIDDMVNNGVKVQTDFNIYQAV